MEVLNGDGGSPWVIESIQSLDTEGTHRREIEHQEQEEDGEDAHPRCLCEVALTVVLRTEHRIIVKHILHVIRLDLGNERSCMKWLFNQMVPQGI